ncbi:MAG: 4Fe-4S binding protein, partial [Duodenibacillus sp.]|nr:4Fe-4S binding protein [Duodenibacillus sp.]
MRINTFPPPKGCRGEDGPAFQGNFRKGELRGIIKINTDRCVGCDTCTKMCPVDAIRGSIGVAHRIENEACVSCGQCLIACPFNAIEQMSFVDDVMKALDDPKKLVVAHPSPADRVSLAEEFGGKPGELTIGRMWAALEKAG